MSFVFTLRPSFTLSSFVSNVFGSVPETEDHPEVRDMQGPSMRQRAEAERQARMQAATSTADS
jgi:hypothetical protein